MQPLVRDGERILECLHAACVRRGRIERIRIGGIHRRVFRDWLASASVVLLLLRRILTLSCSIVGGQHPCGCQRGRARSQKTTPRPTLLLQFIGHVYRLQAGFDHNAFLLSVRSIPYLDSWRDTIPKVHEVTLAGYFSTAHIQNRQSLFPPESGCDFGPLLLRPSGLYSPGGLPCPFTHLFASSRYRESSSSFAKNCSFFWSRRAGSPAAFASISTKRCAIRWFSIFTPSGWMRQLSMLTPSCRT